MKDLGGLMKKAQEMQAKMTEAQQRLETLEVTGEAGAGLVKLTLTAKGDAALTSATSVAEASSKGESKGESPLGIQGGCDWDP